MGIDTATLNHFVATGALALQAVIVAMIAVYVMRPTSGVFARLATLASSWGLAIAFFTSLAASSLTLFYSEVIGYPPCPLCWWQRICMFPQVILFAIALRTKDAAVATYSIALSLIGLCIALYHHALQILPSGTLPCPAQGTVSCGQRLIFEYGYVTFPLLAATLFTFLIVLMFFVRRLRA